MITQKRRMLSQCNWRTIGRVLANGIALLSSLATTASAQTLQLPDALRSEVYYWAPFVVRETLTDTSCPQTSLWANQMVRVDFDLDNDASNNDAHAMCGGYAADVTATVYFSAVETGMDQSSGYYFLTYYWYEPRDRGFVTPNGLLGDAGHSNDLEGAMLIIRKGSGNPGGCLVAALTQAHGALLPWLPNPVVGASCGSPTAGSCAEICVKSETVLG